MSKQPRKEVLAAHARLATETLEPLRYLCNLLGHVSLGAATRYVLSGRHGVYLDGVRIDREWYTSREAIARFLARQPEGAGTQTESAT
jgi:hypothetical protein